MTEPIRIHEIEAAEDDPQRLNLFAGRHMGEREFDLLQAYADDRLSPLLLASAPGILDGLTVAVTGTLLDQRIHVRPGSATGTDGRVVRLIYPLDQTWKQLRDQVEAERLRRRLPQALPDGIYLLCLRRAVELVDADEDQDPCRRTEPDPLRDRRLETVAMLGLAFITAEAGLMSMTQARAANRLCVRFLDQQVFDEPELGGGVPLGLVKVVSGVPAWFDTVAGRYEALADSAYRTFLAHTWSVLAAFSRDRIASKAAPLLPPLPGLSQLVGIDFLPAAGALPALLLRDPGAEDPSLAFDPRDLQVELIPVPEATVPGVVERELPRGVVNLVHMSGDRMRMMLAIPDADYRPDLMNKPQVDAELEADLVARSDAAIAAWQLWKEQWLAIFNQLTDEQMKGVEAPPLPSDEAQFLRQLTPRDYLDTLVTRREKLLPPETPLPKPYIDWKLKPRIAEQNPAPATSAAPGLYARRESLRKDIEDLQDELEEGFRLLNEINDYLALQRRQLDAITVSFSALAGGSPGDGSGINLMRWTNYAFFKPEQKTE